MMAPWPTWLPPSAGRSRPTPWRVRRSPSACCTKSPTWPAPTRDRGVFLVGVHKLLATLIDAENFYLALYDEQSGKITYPYYVDVIDVEALGSRELRVPHSRPPVVDRPGVDQRPATVDRRQGHCLGRASGTVPLCRAYSEFWRGSPLKNARDEVFGMIAMQVYDVERAYSAEDRRLVSGRGPACGHGLGPYPAPRRPGRNGVAPYPGAVPAQRGAAPGSLRAQTCGAFAGSAVPDRRAVEQARRTRWPLSQPPT